MYISFNTLGIFHFGCILLTVYIIVLAFQKRLAEIELAEIGGVFLSSSSIMGGSKLIYSTLSLLNDNTIESDKIYTIYGGFCVVYVSVMSYRQKIHPKKKRTEN